MGRSRRMDAATATAQGTTMEAVVQDRYGDVDVLDFRTSPGRCPRTTRCCCECARPASIGVTGM